MFKRVLISNRGEIAIRIATAARSLGMESVGVYSPVDEFSLHTRSTTESHEIGSREEAVSAYLDIELLIQMAGQNTVIVSIQGTGSSLRMLSLLRGVRKRDQGSRRPWMISRSKNSGFFVW